MLGDKTSCVVPGEASETDEEDNTNTEQPSTLLKDAPKTIVAGEASESENEDDSDYHITAEAFKSKAEEVQYNSLLHRKLRESNAKLKQDLNILVNSSLRSAVERVNEINHRLLTNQIEIQDTVKYLRRSVVTSEKIDKMMSCVVSQNYLPAVKIN